MCGILGVASRAAFDPGLAEAMRDTLRHRGPDDAGLWSAPGGAVWLGQRRLSILDLTAAGHQPMTDAAGRLTVTYNGEIYNWCELKHELSQLGHRFRSGTDTEVLLESYRRWGEACVERFNGMFAFAIYDHDRRRLFLARDRAGEKPLFYWHEPGRFAFASELKALFAHPGCPRRLDLDALNAYLALGYVPGTACIVAGVKKLAPGHLLAYDLATETLTERAYWHLPIPDGRDAGDDALLDELAALLDDSVRLRLRADVPVGIMLSGGIDSSLVTAMAARHQTVKTFTIAFPGQGEYDESAHARAVAAALGTEHVELPALPATVDLLPMLAAQYDEPFADSSMVPTYLVSKLIREHATVALGGDGGDELFAGYPHYRWLERHAQLRRLVPSALRRGMARAAGSLLPLGMRGRTYALSLGGSTADAIAHVNLFFDAQLRRRLLAPLGAGAARGAPEQFRASLCDPARSVLQQATVADFHSYLAEDILTKVDRASMLTSLEVRAPFLDPRLIEFAFGRVPDRLKSNGEGSKVLPRRLARRVLPPTVAERAKRGFAIPARTWFTHEWGRFMVDTLLGSDGAVFDETVVREIIARQRIGLNNTQRLFALALFELWRRHYRVSV
jgi:asparagine synthase (glutamine-hydrolysing)